jgi:LacI family transcriptional regulator
MSAQPPEKRATLKDVAKAAGYHFTTVSLALRDHPSIPEETRKRIAEVATQMGYSRDPVFSVLSHFHTKGRVRTDAPRIAFVRNYGYDNEGRLFPHMQEIWDGAKRQAELLGYQLDTFNVSVDEHDSHSLEAHLRQSGIAGVIIGAFQPGFSDFTLNWTNYAIVKINSGHMEPRATTVTNDQLRDVRLAYRRLAALGYRRIGLAIGRADEDAAHQRHNAGYLMEQASLAPEARIPSLVFPYNYDTPTTSGFVGRWVRRHHLDAVMCNWGNTDRLLALAGLRVPEEVGCACLCITKPFDHLAGIVPNLNLVGERAVSLIATQLKSGEFGVPEFGSVTYVQSKWKDGVSAPPRHG